MAEKYTIDTPAADATTIEKIWPKLNSSQHEWVNNLTADELHTLKKQLNHYGERYSLKYWQSYVNDFEYAETF
jgi:hypothetical protein